MRPGTYTVTAVIALPFRQSLGIALDDARTTFTMVVTSGTGCRATATSPRGCRTTPRPSTPRPADARPHATRPTADAAGEVADTVMDLRSLPAFGSA